MGNSREIQTGIVISRFTEESAIRKITNRKNGGEVKGKSIFHKKPGLSVLAAIDFLVNRVGYFWFKTDYKENKKKKNGED